MAAAASLRRCALPAAAALAAQQQHARQGKHARTEGSALLQWRSSRVAPQSVMVGPVADVREGAAPWRAYTALVGEATRPTTEARGIRCTTR